MRRPKALGVVFAYEGPQPTSEASDKKLTSETGREKDTSAQMGLIEAPRVVAGDCLLVLEEVEP